MKFLRSLFAITTAALLMICLSARAAEPVDIGSRLELFVDHYLIDRLGGAAQLELHEPHDEGNVLKFDEPWEGKFSGYVTVIHDGPVYQIYYYGLPRLETKGEAKSTRPVVTCYAESSDGIHWVKPKLGICEVNGSKDNNVILDHPWLLTGNFSPFIDANPDAPKDQRYKALAGGYDTAGIGLTALVSPDGIHWRVLQEEVFPWKKEEHGLDSQNVAFWSEPEQQYVLYYRHTVMFKPTHSPPYVRSVGRATSSDFVNWTDHGWMTYSDTQSTCPSNQLYTSQTSPYFRAPHIYLATAARLMEGRKVLTDEQAKQIGVDPGYFGDCSDSILMSTRGGMQYDCTFLEALIRPGIGLDNWVSRTNYPAWNIVQTGDNEMSLYTNQDYGQSTAHLERYSMRLDGLASVHAGHAGGELVTKPLTFQGNQLLLNFATSAAGGIRVEIQDADGKPISGFALADCGEVIGNEIERAVVWKNSNELSQLVGKPVRLRFVMKEADLYSLRFR